jgi:tRNA pseudouridine38-40 synthase
MSGYRVQEPESGLRKVKATIEYDGTRYAGFQGQPNQLTIQKELEQALAAVTQEETKVVGAGRTDAGVHAKGQVVHFVTAWKRSLDELQRAFNALLPRDIAVRQMTWVTPDFHARFSAVSREYRYTILNRQVRSPLEARYAYQYASALDAGAMAEAVRCLLGRHDFASFGQPTQGDSTVREAIHASCARENDHIYVDLTANAFLRRMVRTVVGTLVLVGAGRMSPPDVNRILQARDRSQAGAPAPAHGLCLMTVNYQGVKE